jgi:carnitine-CoA ligase
VTAPAFPAREQSVVPAMLAAAARERPDKTYLVFAGGAEWTYGDTLEQAWRGAAALRAVGVGFGERVSLLAPSGEDLVRVWFGAATLGAVFAPINLAARGNFLQHTMNVAGARVLVVHPELAERLSGLELPCLETVLVTGPTEGIDLPWPAMPLAELLDAPPPVIEREPEPWDDALLIYTSGTTGPSKGVALSSAAAWLFDRHFTWPDVGPEDRFLQALPMFHMSGIGSTYSMLLRRGSAAILPAFDAKSFWTDVRHYGATVSCVLHAMVSYLLSHPSAPDDADNPLRIVYMGPLSHVQEFSQRFGVGVYSAFGMTEAAVPIRTALNPTDEKSCGRAVDPEHYEVRIVDEHDVPVSPGTPGELVLRHRLPWVINSGYHGMAEATATAWRNGWFHTGDQLMADAEGNFYFVDRVKDAIRRRGENISSFEVEAEVLAHPEVAEVAAIAVANPDVDRATGDEEVKIVVVRTQASLLSAEALTEFLIERMPRHWVPRFVEFADELPRTPSFKVKKAELRARGNSGQTWDRVAAGIVLKREQLA